MLTGWPERTTPGPPAPVLTRAKLQRPVVLGPPTWQQITLRETSLVWASLSKQINGHTECQTMNTAHGEGLLRRLAIAAAITATTVLPAAPALAAAQSKPPFTPIAPSSNGGDNG